MRLTGRQERRVAGLLASALRRGWSLAEVGRRAGVSQSTVRLRALASGAWTPSMAVFHRARSMRGFVQERLRAGDTYQAITAACGVSPVTVFRIARQMGLRRAHPTKDWTSLYRMATTRPVRELAEEFALSRQRIHKILARKGIRPPQRQNRKSLNINGLRLQ